MVLSSGRMESVGFDFGTVATVRGARDTHDVRAQIRVANGQSSEVWGTGLVTLGEVVSESGNQEIGATLPTSRSVTSGSTGSIETNSRVFCLFPRMVR